MTTVIHANWCDNALHLWAEDSNLFSSPGAPGAHPFALAAADLAPRLAAAHAHTLASIRLALPAASDRPLPSPPLAHALGRSPDADDSSTHAVIQVFEAPSLRIAPADAAAALASISEQLSGSSDGLIAGASLDYFALAARLARHILTQQRFVPMLVQSLAGDLHAAWAPWMSDEATAARVSMLAGAMPASARAGVDPAAHDAWAITGGFLAALVDAAARRTLARERFADSIEDKPLTDPHVAWLTGLLAQPSAVPASTPLRQELAKRVRSWIALLEERGVSSAWRLLLRLSEPDDLAARKPDPAWRLSFHLQSVESPAVVVDAQDLWLLSTDAVTIQGRRLDRPHELILAELARASRLYPRLEKALEESEPSALELDTRRAYDFLREIRPILAEQGFAVEVPRWWDSPTARLGAKLRLDSGDFDPFAPISPGATPAARASLGLGALVKYHWEISVGDTSLSLPEFEQLAAKRMPLVRINGRWVEIRPEDVQTAIKFIRENPGGEIGLGDAIRLAYAADPRETGLPIVGLETSGWLNAFLKGEAESHAIRLLDTPRSFHGTLRPYQARGLSWLVFQERLGFGACLADDMGLGKTIQLLALLAYERERAAGMSDEETQGQRDQVNTGSVPEASAPPLSVSPSLPPTLLLVPMSVVGNWIHETRRFCPQLRLLVHHGPERPQGDAFLSRAAESDLVITTYALANRDRELIEQVGWRRVVLDEAQYIKNPAAKQSQAARSFSAPSRVALTGTPVENRLAELWSIMDFLNPGYLGTPGGFRSRFSLPIERYHDRFRAEQLRGLIRPFVLRRLKTDPNVVADLPEKFETREFTHLTGEQAALYEACVKRMLTEVDQAEGIQRRGLVLAALVKLKQICDHPALALKEPAPISQPPDPARSGKCIRLLEMMEEILAEGDKALLFTQFRSMGDLLAPMLRHHLGADVLFLHGGTTQPQRQQIIDSFQRSGGPPILLLSLKAGGVGLNLTAATHVFHFDRWWNPAVENQATDRAYRIGQTRTVQVHKFVVSGTLEERIDQMIESKTELAENIIGSGETWLSDLSTAQLRDILTLRNDAVDDEG